MRLRTFVPALQAFAAAGDVDMAFQARRGGARVRVKARVRRLCGSCYLSLALATCCVS